MRGLTEKQRNILDFIEDFMDVNIMAPTVYEIAEHFAIKTSTVFAHIRSLQKKNYLTRSSKARSISLKHPHKKNRRPAGLRTVPVYESPEELGSNARKNSKELLYDSSALKNMSDSRRLFAIKIGCDAMHEIGILPGDVAILKRGEGSVKNGDIVLVKVDGKPELRTYKQIDGGNVELGSSLKSGKAVTGKIQDFPLEGIVVGLQRSM